MVHANITASLVSIQFNSKLYFHNNIHQNQNLTKNTVQQKDKKVMDEKAGRPKRPDNSLPLSKPNYEQKQVC